MASFDKRASVVSVSFYKHERRARALGKKEQKSRSGGGGGGRGGEGKETPAAEHRHFTERRSSANGNQ